MQVQTALKTDTLPIILPDFVAEDPPAVLTLPGLDGSCERHWQTHWESLSWVNRVEFGHWDAPTIHEWLPVLDAAVRDAPGPVTLVAHSLGCVAAAWWATLAWDHTLDKKVNGALLVAPADVDAVDTDPRLRDFRPMPTMRLPFPSILVASRNDPYATFARQQAMAAAWGSELIDAGEQGHINVAARIGEWTEGLKHLARLQRRNPALVVAELGLRKAFA